MTCNCNQLNNRKFEKVSLKEWMKNIPEDVNVEQWSKLYDELNIPKRGTALSAGYDVSSPFEFSLSPGDEIKIPTGIRAFMNKDNALFALPRSGHGFKYYIRLANTIGLVDADYVLSDNEGHIFVKLRNEGDKSMTIKKGEGMCQLVFMPYLLTQDDDFTGGVRNGGFGSTSK